MSKIILNSAKSVTSTNVDSNIGIELERKTNLLPYGDVSTIVNQNTIYQNELNNCNNYRYICSINTICSNVLFNNITEIIYKEGSEDIVVVPNRNNGVINYDNFIGSGIVKPKNTSDIYTTQCIRDTEYTHKDIGPYVYHCGVDIFNNHTLRSVGFDNIITRDVDELPSLFEKDKYVEGDNNYSINDTFNTIRDYKRYNNGKMLNELYSNLNTPVEIHPHVYQYDTLLSFEESFTQNLTSVDGWYGFVNPNKMDIPNVDNLSINKCMNNNKPCEFIDMFPDRSLFNFTPKINKYRGSRIENNWDYCLTYPYKNYYDHPYLMGYGTTENLNGLLINSVTLFNNESNISKCKFISTINHNLVVGDKINVYIRLSGSRDNFIKIPTTITIETVDKYAFTFSNNDYEFDNMEVRIVKLSNGYPCEYYFRIFKRIPNFNYLKQNINDADYNITDDDIDYCSKFDFNSNLNKLGFSKNIFNDNLSQIVFSDNIILDKLVDNRNRPLSEIFITLIKNNKGYMEWYYDKDYSNPEIEFSRAFGKLTSGLNLSASINDYNVRKIHNIVNHVNIPPLNIPSSPKHLSSAQDSNIVYNITSKQGDFDDNSYYGDIVEYNPITINEVTLENVYHRFNTAQREYDVNGDITYRDIIYDEIIKDDFDFNTDGEEVGTLFKVDEYIYNKYGADLDVYPSNLAPEGYFYSPHNSIKINTFNTTIQQAYDIKLEYKYLDSGVYNGFNIITLRTPINYLIENGDSIKVIKKGSRTIYNGEIIINENIIKNSDLLNINIKFDEITSDLLDILKNNTAYIYRKNPFTPSYAQYLGDDSGRYLWRDITLKSDMSVNNELYNMTFTNGSLYLYSNINLYVRRQDPFGTFGLQYTNNINPQKFFAIKGGENDVSAYEYVNNSTNTDIC